MTDTPTPQETDDPDVLAWRLRAQVRTLERDLTACRAALRELVACKDLKERIEAFGPREDWVDDYARRKPLAWAAARAILPPDTIGEGEKSC